MNFYNDALIETLKFVKNNNNMKHYLILSMFSMIFLGCTVTAQKDKENIEGKFQSILDDAVKKHPDIIGISIAIIAPDVDVHWTGAAGYDTTEKDQKLSADQPFRVASVTKTYVAAAILRLYETGAISLNDPIAKYISEAHKKLLIEDGYDPEKITIKQCLYHRSGLYDYAMDASYMNAAFQQQDKRWTRTEQIQYAMKYGDPLGTPGSVYSYSDTGYILLGEIIEKVQGDELANALRTLLSYDKLKLNSTWLESLEDRPQGLPRPVHRYHEGMDFTAWDNSIDLYGGGGIASTTEDMAVFFNGLFNGKVFDKEETLTLMLTKPEELSNQKDNTDYRMGLRRALVEEGVELFMHDGFWGTLWVHIPDYNCTITTNYTNDGSAGVVSSSFRVVKELLKKQKK